jgi:hypothetical protein
LNALLRHLPLSGHPRDGSLNLSRRPFAAGNGAQRRCVARLKPLDRFRDILRALIGTRL